MGTEFYDFATFMDTINQEEHMPEVKQFVVKGVQPLTAIELEQYPEGVLLRVDGLAAFNFNNNTGTVTVSKGNLQEKGVGLAVEE